MACAATGLATRGIAVAPCFERLVSRSRAAPRLFHRAHPRAERDSETARVRPPRVFASSTSDTPFPLRLVDPSRASPGLGAPPSARPPCAWCGDTGASSCRTCGGAGTLSPGGFHSKNHVDLKSVVGTNWTAHVRTKGWRHFEAAEVSPADKKAEPPRTHASVRLIATCDRDVHVWVSVADLKDRVKWSAGWKQREELAWSGDASSEKGAVASPKRRTSCPRCQGAGSVPCERKGCAIGAERVRRDREIRERANEKMRRAMLEARRKADDTGDVAALAFAKRAKKTLKETGKMKKSRKEKRSARIRGEKDDDDDDSILGGNANANGVRGEQDWGARARRLREERLEAFVKGVQTEDDGESNQ